MSAGGGAAWGPQRLPGSEMRFRLWAPDRQAVAVEIEGGATTAMRRDDGGWFETELGAGTGALYRFRLDDGAAVPDPASRRQQGGVNGWSVVEDLARFPWRCTDWRGRPWAQMVILELHAGLLGGFQGVERRLAEIAALGVTAIELMPSAAFAGVRGWGYDGVLPYAPHEAYGTPRDLMALVDAAHGLGLSVFLDVVYNHFGPEGNHLGRYARAFFHQDAQTPWGGAVAVDREPVARFFIDNALMWLRDYRFDGLRFDAVHAIGDAAFLDRMAHELRAALPGRQVHLVLENEDNDAPRLAPGLYDAQWNDDFHNVMHVLLTGEADAYYADFAERPAERLARCLAEGFVYQGEPSANRKGEPRGAASGCLAPAAFVAFLQNHDQVGNRALGERLIRLADAARLRAAVALLLLCPQVPLLFMGEAEGSKSPFLFFTDFHDELAEAVRRGRRKEFAALPAFADEGARQAIPDPNASETFARSRPEPGPDAQAWRTLYSELLALRRDHLMPRLAGARALGAAAIGPAAVEARWRLNDGLVLSMALDLGEAPALPAPPAAPLFVEGARFWACIAPAAKDSA